MKALRITKSYGQVVDLPGIELQLSLWLNDATNGDYTLTLERTKKPRSNEQNRLMSVWFNCIAKSWTEATGRGFTAQDAHDAYCLMLLPKELPNGKRIPGETKGLTSEEMTDFLNKVQADAATEYGITLLSITDPIYELWSRQYQNY